MSRRDVSSVPLTSESREYLWWMPVYIGTPPQKLNVAVDTGSSDFWVSNQAFQTSQSSTYQPLQRRFAIQYGQGRVSGDIGQDTISLGSMVLQNQAFGIGTDLDALGLGDDVVGVLGLGEPALSRTNITPIWQAAPLDTRMFGLSLQGTEDGTPGLLTLGAYNASLMEGPITYLNTTSPSTWTIPMSGLSVNNSAITLSGKATALVDSGSALVGGPADAIAQLFSLIPGSAPLQGQEGRYTIPCNGVPEISVQLGDRWFIMNPATITTLAVQGEMGDAQALAANDGQTCTSTFYALPGSKTDWTLGSAFLRNFYTVFEDGEQRRIGFSALADRLNSTVISVAHSHGSPTIVPAGAWTWVVLAVTGGMALL